MSDTTNDTDLVPAWAVHGMTSQEVFAPDRVQKILAQIEARAKAEIPDLSTAKGRAAVASLAHKVARSKTLLDDLGKQLVAEWKKQAADVDGQRKTIRDRLDALKVEVRAPLDEWEAAEAERKRRIDAALLHLSNKAHGIINSPPGLSASAMEAEIAKFETELKPTQGDFSDSFQVATENYERCLERMRAALDVRKAQEVAAEAERRIKAAEQAAAEAAQAAAEANRRAVALQRELEEARAPKVEPAPAPAPAAPPVEAASAPPYGDYTIVPTSPDTAATPDRTVVAQITPGSVRIMRDFGYPLNRDPVARINLQAEILRMIAGAAYDQSGELIWVQNDPALEELADKIIAKVCETLSELAGPVAA